MNRVKEHLPERLSYANSGVNLEAADSAVSRIAALAKGTYTPQVLAGVGPFSGLLKLDLAGYTEPVLVSSCDGVGTKLKLAIRWGRHETIGADLVNHCINDILTCGAKPLAFLDYLAVARMDPGTVASVVEGIANACRENNIALIGGETAEMPGIYRPGDYDLAGFITGLVERSRILDPSRVAPGQALIGLRSSGPHTNGYSLVRKIIFDVNQFEWEDRPSALAGSTVGESLLAVHRSYLKLLQPLLADNLVLAMAHITGGGIAGNLVRVLPDNVQAVIDTSRWPQPPVFSFLREAGNLDIDEMYRVFNMGVGMILITETERAPQVIDRLAGMNEEAFLIGHLGSGTRDVRLLSPH